MALISYVRQPHRLALRTMHRRTRTPTGRDNQLPPSLDSIAQAARAHETQQPYGYGPAGSTAVTGSAPAVPVTAADQDSVESSSFLTDRVPAAIVHLLRRNRKA